MVIPLNELALWIGSATLPIQLVSASCRRSKAPKSLPAILASLCTKQIAWSSIVYMYILADVRYLIASILGTSSPIRCMMMASPLPALLLATLLWGASGHSIVDYGPHEKLPRFRFQEGVELTQLPLHKLLHPEGLVNEITLTLTAGVIEVRLIRWLVYPNSGASFSRSSSLHMWQYRLTV